jgi:glutamyl-tRNA synthetase
MDHQMLAERLFPLQPLDKETLARKYPPRVLPEGAKVTRLGPSPTGFIHLGNLYGAFVDERLAHQSGGLFYLRIEDTDDKRLVQGAVDMIIDSLAFFGISFDEGATKTGDRGDYGPYEQSLRKELYHCYVKDLVARGLAYPCFLTEDEIAQIRQEQETAKANPGIYGKYATHRDLSMDQIEKFLSAGLPYTIRLKSGGNHDLPQDQIRYIKVEDGIRGTLSMPENNQDVVILKANGMPTYHFAHVVDDYLMRTTHVVRGEEWLSTLPIHVELFEKLGFELPVYCHTAQLMKLDENGNKRKLSKRKDPELSLGYYQEVGYHPLAIREYLLTLLNSNFEEWRLANPELPSDEFQFTTEKMSASGALFDINKLNDVSKDCLVRIPAGELYEFLLGWAAAYHKDAWTVLSEDRAKVEAILDLGRGDAKPRKDFISASQMFQFIQYFFDGYFTIEEPLPAEVSKEDAAEILSRYVASYDHGDDQSAWFEKIREITADMGYAVKPKDFKNNPDQYKGHVGHVSTVVRLALVGRSQSPDLWEIQQILGAEKTIERIRKAAF